MNKELFVKFMKRNNDTQTSLAEAMGMTQSAINARINGKIEFRKNEINFIRKRWNLTDHETVEIFFIEVVSEEDTIIEKGA